MNGDGSRYMQGADELQYWKVPLDHCAWRQAVKDALHVPVELPQPSSAHKHGTCVFLELPHISTPRSPLVWFTAAANFCAGFFLIERVAVSLATDHIRSWSTPQLGATGFSLPESRSEAAVVIPSAASSRNTQYLAHIFLADLIRHQSRAHSRRATSPSLRFWVNAATTVRSNNRWSCHQVTHLDPDFSG